ncbi:uncharacterized protein LOC132262798 isoform X2 [Phlebotomus argentipes]|uniref:uncharacterized protein LOC132262798 isoform X2 n=1 Tax=Phlebotomus argentipes TaxID=94469 RepID=UPI00289374E1|nr:uncharacterized protein LOC132262798 isoform X2 [Phlebotomus argentipes]
MKLFALPCFPYTLGFNRTFMLVKFVRLIRKERARLFIVTVLEELLKKLEIEHVVWSVDKKGHFHQVIFPSASGDPCETMLHCLTELGIGIKLESNVSVVPCSVTFDATKDVFAEEELSEEEQSKWDTFVDSIRSKLTVKQVVDGVRAGGSLSFDYLLLIVTADSLAALGLVENNAPNITAAMLVSPLMGPVMSITFGAIISDYELMKVGFVTLAVGMFLSLLFGFIFGLILGTTEMPWGFGDWPTEEMKGRGNARSLWMGVLWALTSGTGVAVALLQGSAGPLIGVAISASLLPPVVNCGLFWALACIWLIYDDVKMPHLKGEPYTGNSSYVPIYTDYIPTEFFVNGIVSCLLTVVNVICIFITAIIVLKIKEVASPYTSSPDLRRFWETDIRTVRKTNRSTIRRKNATEINSTYEEMTEPTNKKLGTVLERALKEAVDDDTFRKVKRMSYSSNAADELPHSLALPAGATPTASSGSGSVAAGVSGSKTIGQTDLVTLDKLVTSLLDRSASPQSRGSFRLNRLRSLSRSTRGDSLRRPSAAPPSTTTIGGDPLAGSMPTIPEGNRTASWTERNMPGVRHVLSSIANAPHRFSQASGGHGEENTRLTKNTE